MFLCYFQAIIVIDICYNCVIFISIIVFIIVFICQFSFCFTSIIVYNCVYEFQTFCLMILPICIYNLSKHFATSFCHIIYIAILIYIIFQNNLPLSFANLYIYIIFQNDLSLLFANLYIDMLYLSIQLFFITILFYYSFLLLYIDIFSIQYSTIQLYSTTIIIL